MIIDTSAVLAILLQESDAGSFAMAIAKTRVLRISAVSIVECSIVLRGREVDGAEDLIDRFVSDANMEIVAVDEPQSRIARQAYARFGKGTGHPARLNFGDCFSYALAEAMGEPLLFKGNNFSQTDIAPAPLHTD
ncbi:MAG: type II toxin-antitoxin system VapC family toxin [Alphaproteobacteria bacterium]